MRQIFSLSCEVQNHTAAVIVEFAETADSHCMQKQDYKQGRM